VKSIKQDKKRVITREELIAGKKGGEVAKAVTRTGRFGNELAE